MMNQDSMIADVHRIMSDFAEWTGLSDTTRAPRRYLWTDAHAVCNFLSLYRRTADVDYRNLAIALIDQVHHVLGRHRDDDPRRGWISGLDEHTGSQHPTAGGLRIGKELNERARDAPYDDRLEWDRDGQYFHYLTKWMHALMRASVVIGDSRYRRWALELAQAAHAGFAVLRTPAGRKRLAWKMSIDLSYVLVPSTGQHDALDAWVTYNELPDLESEISDIEETLDERAWNTSDPLGIGGLLFDAGRVFQLTAAKQVANPDLLSVLARVSLESLTTFAADTPLRAPAEYRLAFRELGLSIGLRAIAIMQRGLEASPELFADSLRRDVEDLAQYVDLGDAISEFWSRPGHQQQRTWREHREINAVMLATSLLPDEFLAAS
jgi:hypothetical protein